MPVRKAQVVGVGKYKIGNIGFCMSALFFAVWYVVNIGGPFSVWALG